MRWWDGVWFDTTRETLGRVILYRRRKRDRGTWPAVKLDKSPFKQTPLFRSGWRKHRTVLGRGGVTSCFQRLEPRNCTRDFAGISLRDFWRAGPGWLGANRGEGLPTVLSRVLQKAESGPTTGPGWEKKAEMGESRWAGLGIGIFQAAGGTAFVCILPSCVPRAFGARGQPWLGGRGRSVLRRLEGRRLLAADDTSRPGGVWPGGQLLSRLGAAG